MTELKDDLDRALRSVTFGEAPVQRALRDGRRLRNRRRLTAAAAAAIVVAAAGYPALTRNAATAPPVTGGTQNPVAHRGAAPRPGHHQPAGHRRRQHRRCRARGGRRHPVVRRDQRRHWRP